jgi:hypothetical protein
LCQLHRSEMDSEDPTVCLRRVAVLWVYRQKKKREHGLAIRENVHFLTMAYELLLVGRMEVQHVQPMFSVPVHGCSWALPCRFEPITNDVYLVALIVTWDLTLVLRAQMQMDHDGSLCVACSNLTKM